MSYTRDDLINAWKEGYAKGKDDPCEDGPWGYGEYVAAAESFADAYAATLRQPSADSGRVGDEVVDRVAKAIADAAGHGMREKCEHLARAALAAQGQGEGEPVAWLRRDVTYSGVEGRSEGERVVSERKVYADDIPLFPHPAPAASPAGVPDVMSIMAHLPDNRAATRAELIRAFQLAAVPSAIQESP